MQLQGTGRRADDHLHPGDVHVTKSTDIAFPGCTSHFTSCETVGLETSLPRTGRRFFFYGEAILKALALLLPPTPPKKKKNRV